ncbi:MAG: hypothetical protein AB7V18_19095 [Pyrinomonadaceae bacterium]
MPSGVAEQINGKWVGFTDFTEFALQGPGALPAGLTLRGNAFPNAPNSFSVVADVTVGRYFAMAGQDTSHWGISYDVFDGLVTQGEFLSRTWIATNLGNRRVIGPAMMSTDAPAAHDLFGGHVFKRSNVDFEAEVGFYLNGGGDSAGGADMRAAEQAGVWVWTRWQRLPGNPGTSEGVLIKCWYGDYDTEPAGWEFMNANFTPNIANLNRLGWGFNAVGNADEQRIAFFAFSEDPSVSIVPPPGGFPSPPGTPGAPTVVVNPLQDRWVGLEGSAFVVP